ncbi:hypothetical protein DFH27DRAFT_466850, partial [Peziza echinospora]
FDCCVAQCVAFTGEYAELDRCPTCQEERFFPGHNAGPIANRKPRKKWLYIPIIPRLFLQFSNARRARILQEYPLSLTTAQGEYGVEEDLRGPGPNRVYSDFWDGRLYREMSEAGYFADPRELAFLLTAD